MTEAGSGQGQTQNSEERQYFAISSIPSVITNLFTAWSSIGIKSTVVEQ
jgi:hypothetical protein